MEQLVAKNLETEEKNYMIAMNKQIDMQQELFKKAEAEKQKQMRKKAEEERKL